jgi:hypothetical protein
MHRQKKLGYLIAFNAVVALPYGLVARFPVRLVYFKGSTIELRDPSGV